ncbi:MAG: thiamine-binding protein [Candidatus Hydrogenedentes bacterium]|nr:thiamine-binding protein [Candidatus Hydrogenedentota bacterium]
MNVQAEVSIYPLRTEHMSGTINEFLETLKQEGIEVSPGPMSTWLEGEADIVFESVRHAFAQAAERFPVVLVLKLSNSCPTGANRKSKNADIE